VEGSDVQMDMVQLPTSHSQRLNSGKPSGTGRCESRHLHDVQVNHSQGEDGNKLSFAGYN